MFVILCGGNEDLKRAKRLLQYAKRMHKPNWESLSCEIIWPQHSVLSSGICCVRYVSVQVRMRELLWISEHVCTYWAGWRRCFRRSSSSSPQVQQKSTPRSREQEFTAFSLVSAETLHLKNTVLLSGHHFIFVHLKRKYFLFVIHLAHSGFSVLFWSPKEIKIHTCKNASREKKSEGILTYFR